MSAATELGSSLFETLADASGYFESGNIGWSPGRAGRLEGMALEVDRWSVRPVRIDHLASSWFDDPLRVPPGTMALDCGLMMDRTVARWRPVASDQAVAGASTSSVMSSAGGAARCSS